MHLLFLIQSHLASCVFFYLFSPVTSSKFIIIFSFSVLCTTKILLSTHNHRDMLFSTQGNLVDILSEYILSLAPEPILCFQNCFLNFQTCFAILEFNFLFYCTLFCGFNPLVNVTIICEIAVHRLPPRCY